MKDKKCTKKNILLGVTGGIAAYKSAELIRLFKKEGFNVKVIMTENSKQFITPLTLAVLSENKVCTTLFSEDKEDNEIRHISLAQWADIIIIAPATANTIAKIAHGIADDILTSTVLAFSGKLFFAPAMNSVMINNPIYQENTKYLLGKGYFFINSEKGSLACGDYGDGRMVEPKNIVNFIKKQYSFSYLLKNVKILVTASATREPIDEVRFLSNRSTGKMGFAIAEAAQKRGAIVTLITGPTCLQSPVGIKTIHINTAEEMRGEVMCYFNDTDVFISAAAVADFKPEHKVAGKIKKKEHNSFSLQLGKNVDILKEAGKRKNKQILVGFAAEVKDLKKNALDKLKLKNLDLVIVNDITRKDSGFGTETNKVTIFDDKSLETDLPLMSKYELAEYILEKIQSIYKNRTMV